MINFIESPICFEYNDGNIRQLFPPSLVDFLNQTDACQSSCSQQLLVSVCSPFDWQDGVCDELCNIEECSYDGGDCNQLCSSNHECDIFSMLNNGQCDVACNNSECSWDSPDCHDSEYLIFSDLNGTYCNQLQQSEFESDNLNKSQLCDISWVNDGWCDTNCRFSETCLNDGNDCQCENVNPCWFLYKVMDNVVDDGDVLGFDEFCEDWQSLTLNQENLLNIENSSCSYVFEYFDKNGDDGVDVNEIIYAMRSFPEINATEIKARQIDCSYTGC